jgi:DNA-binding LytR/AlgR family response regulator
MVTMHRVLIVDDEPLARNYLSTLLQNHHLDFKVVASVESTVKAWETIQNNPDIEGIFLDIDIETESKRAGLDFALNLNRLPQKPWIVFVTGYQEYAIEAFQSFPINYLVKPFDNVTIEPTLKWIREHFYGNPKSKRVAIRHRINDSYCTEYVCRDEILYIQKNNGINSVKIGLTHGEILDGVNSTLKEWVEQGFFQIHRRNLVNLDQIRREMPRIGENSVYKVSFKHCATELDIGPDYLQPLRDVLASLI